MVCSLVGFVANYDRQFLASLSVLNKDFSDAHDERQDLFVFNIEIICLTNKSTWCTRGRSSCVVFGGGCDEIQAKLAQNAFVSNF